MFQRLKTLTLLIVLSGFVSTANAGLLIEPYLGYHTGEVNDGSTKDDFSGMTYGARVGYQHALGLMFGVDYMTGSWEQDSNPKADLTPAILGVFVGYDFPVLLRVYGVYSLSNEVKHKDTSGSSTMKGDGAIKLGVGFTGLPLVSINLEYLQASYDKSGSTTLTPAIKASGYGLTVSIPFDL